MCVTVSAFNHLTVFTLDFYFSFQRFWFHWRVEHLVLIQSVFLSVFLRKTMGAYIQNPVVKCNFSTILRKGRM